ncbi:hypothetical protein [Gilvimarinus agarilyticus]|uniref:hypothetical protein n=1 Tax=Gilvimarinus agarilyticus TaxID=679259 RepID=UPI00059F91C1|nr:hypothetical protein [Gilvimarinus agarilyticus]
MKFPILVLALNCVFPTIIVSAILPIKVKGQGIPDIHVTTNQQIYQGSMDDFQLHWESYGRLINTFERDLEIIDQYEKKCEAEAKKYRYECQIRVLEDVVAGEKSCSDILDDWSAVQLNLGLSYSLAVTGGSIEISTASPGDRNQSCTANVNAVKELELTRCKARYHEHSSGCSIF